jgi:hypothetical protein
VDLPRSFAKRSKSLIQLVLVAAAVTLAAAGGAWAQDCESMSGPSRTDCFTGRARISGEKAAIAGTAALIRIDQERLRAVTGGTFTAKPHRTKSRHRKVHVE